MPDVVRRLSWLVVPLVIVIVAAGAVSGAVLTASGRGSGSGSGDGIGSGTWFTPGSPKLQVSVAAGCPASVAGYADVVNTFPGPPLLPAAPTAGLICQYGPGVGLGPDSSGRSLLVSSTRLDQTQAQQLARAIRQLDLAGPSGVFFCPMDDGAVDVIGFTYPGRSDVGLWYTTSGCQTLDNGRIGAFQGANPSFYDGFENVINQLSPPAN